MNTEDALRAGMAARPHDATPRLVLADYLDDAGRGAEATAHRIIGNQDKDPVATARASGYPLREVARHLTREAHTATVQANDFSRRGNRAAGLLSENTLGDMARRSGGALIRPDHAVPLHTGVEGDHGITAGVYAYYRTQHPGTGTLSSPGMSIAATKELHDHYAEAEMYHRRAATIHAAARQVHGAK